MPVQNTFVFPLVWTRLKPDRFPYRQSQRAADQAVAKLERMQTETSQMRQELDQLRRERRQVRQGPNTLVTD